MELKIKDKVEVVLIDTYDLNEEQIEDWKKYLNKIGVISRIAKANGRYPYQVTFPGIPQEDFSAKELRLCLERPNYFK